MLAGKDGIWKKVILAILAKALKVIYTICRLLTRAGKTAAADENPRRTAAALLQ